MAAGYCVRVAAVVGGRRGSLPQFVHDGAALGALEHVRGRSVRDENRSAGCIMAGHDAADLFGHFPSLYRPARMRASSSVVGYESAGKPYFFCIALTACRLFKPKNPSILP